MGARAMSMGAVSVLEKTSSSTPILSPTAAVASPVANYHITISGGTFNNSNLSFKNNDAECGDGRNKENERPLENVSHEEDWTNLLLNDNPEFTNYNPSSIFNNANDSLNHDIYSYPYLSTNNASSSSSSFDSTVHSMYFGQDDNNSV